MFGARGASAEGVRQLAYTRDLGDAHELQIVSLPENVVTFSARDDLPFAGCSLFLRALSGQGAVVELVSAPGDGGPRRRLGLVAAGEATPSLTVTRDDGEWPLEHAMSGSRVVENLGRRALRSRSLADHADPDRVLAAEAGELFAELRSAGDWRFFGVVRGADAAIWVADPDDRAAPLVDPPGPAAAFGLETDGRDLVWFERDDQGVIRLWVSPFATDAAGLEPRVLRAAVKDSLVNGRGVVGGGFAAHLELDGGSRRLIVTRLADGASWEIPARDGHLWSDPLYIDGGELAVVESADAGRLAASVVRSSQAWSIVRWSLGAAPPHPRR